MHWCSWNLLHTLCKQLILLLRPGWMGGHWTPWDIWYITLTFATGFSNLRNSGLDKYLLIGNPYTNKLGSFIDLISAYWILGVFCSSVCSYVLGFSVQSLEAFILKYHLLVVSSTRVFWFRTTLWMISGAGFHGCCVPLWRYFASGSRWADPSVGKLLCVLFRVVDAVVLICCIWTTGFIIVFLVNIFCELL